ncbi:uncharacterized protein SOCE836_040850 [Sorangium cellulosum]|uniref:Uncharacterized protein n=1 Tax=Sorangium cellulosum TaxID=56 RepID=A0A4P2QP94_SORCE|nr:uncharacterized protein SOCE836_040850 [Sorangium cellulosum]WCQ91324.1 hypothetical protein NQZ70_04040 [Sorangium sp. Soce836]
MASASCPKIHWSTEALTAAMLLHGPILGWSSVAGTTYAPSTN